MSDVEGSDVEGLLPPVPQCKTYKRRWYILTIFSLQACMQCLVWNTFGPIDLSVKYAYDWSDFTLAMMPNWGTIMFIITCWPMMWLLETRGLRFVVVLNGLLVSSGCVLRAISTNPTVFTLSSHACAILNGIAGVTVMASPPVISSAWFPPNQRTTATSLIQAMNQMGLAVTYFMGPLLVPDNAIPTSTVSLELQNHSISKEDIRLDIQYYMIGDAAIAVLVCIGFLLYFPSKPPLPPSASSSVQRTEFNMGIRHILTNRNICLSLLAYAIPSGTVGAWASIMTLDLNQALDISDEESGLIGTMAVIASCVTAQLFALGTDRFFKRRLKFVLLVLVVLALANFGWLFMLCHKVIAYSQWQLYTSIILGLSFTFSLTPLLTEYTVESAYPISENQVGTFMAAGNNVFAFSFLCVFFDKKLTQSLQWINYFLILALAVPIPLLAFTKGELSRLRIDASSSHREEAQQDEEEQENHVIST